MVTTIPGSTTHFFSVSVLLQAQSMSNFRVVRRYDDDFSLGMQGTGSHGGGGGGGRRRFGRKLAPRQSRLVGQQAACHSSHSNSVLRSSSWESLDSLAA